MRLQHDREKTAHITSRIYAEQRKLNAEAHKITRENFWHPMGVAMAVVATIASITGMAIKLFL